MFSYGSCSLTVLRTLSKQVQNEYSCPSDEQNDNLHKLSLGGSVLVPMQRYCRMLSAAFVTSQNCWFASAPLAVPHADLCQRSTVPEATVCSVDTSPVY